MGKISNKSIARRWFVNSFSFVAAILIVTDALIYFMLRSYYYNAARQYLQTEASIIAGIITRYNDYSTDNALNIRRTVESFEQKNHMELMAITKAGKVALMSGGFSPQADYEMPDFETALVQESGSHVGRMPNGEKYMAVSVLLIGKEGIGEYSAIRMVTSLEKIDDQIGKTILLVTFVCVAILLLVLLLGLYFVKSIVLPIQSIGAVARDFARGDFSRRVPVPARDDEIKELCSIFNNMADDLHSMEAMKNDFISSVSHELRTPLTAIKGWSETLLETTDDKKTVEKGIKIVLSETSRLTLMVEELLDFSNIQSGKLKLQLANMDVLAELADAVLIYVEKAAREGIEIKYREPEDAAVIYGDKNRIRQVFINIIDNAVKYSSRGCTVNIDAANNKNDVMITVKDNGCGISETDLPKIKEKFYKANNSKRGSGIGLAIAESIVVQHGGVLNITGKEGVGTTVSVVLPKAGQ